MNDSTAERAQRAYRAGHVRVRVIGPFDRGVRLEGPAGELADEVVLLVSRAGSVSSTQGTRSMVLNQLDATFVLNSLPHAHHLPAGSALYCFTLPRKLLTVATAQRRILTTSRAIDRTALQHSAAAFLTAYCDSLVSGAHAQPGDESTLVRVAAMLILEEPAGA